MSARDINDLMKSLSAKEAGFLDSRFISPVLARRPIRVRIDGVVLSMKITAPKKAVGYEGFGVFQPITMKECRYVREATLAERRKYFACLPRFMMIICGIDEKSGEYLAIRATRDSRMTLDGLAPIHIASNVRMFDVVYAAFDGKNFWFIQGDMAPIRSAKMREQLLAESDHTDQTIPEYQRAYAIALSRILENKRDRNEDRIKDALHRAGAEYRSYVDRGDTYSVEYTVNGQTHRSAVSKDNLSVVSAGICLDGHDQDFDLQSLVHVVKEGDQRSLIVRVGENRTDF